MVPPVPNVPIKYIGPIKLAKACDQKLKSAEEAITKLVNDNDEIKDFNVEEQGYNMDEVELTNLSQDYLNKLEYDIDDNIDSLTALPIVNLNVVSSSATKVR